MEQEDWRKLTHLSDPHLLWWRDHRISMNAQREAALISLSHARAVIAAADAALLRNRYRPR